MGSAEVHKKTLASSCFPHCLYWNPSLGVPTIQKTHNEILHFLEGTVRQCPKRVWVIQNLLWRWFQWLLVVENSLFSDPCLCGFLFVFVQRPTPIGLDWRPVVMPCQCHGLQHPGFGTSWHFSWLAQHFIWFSLDSSTVNRRWQSSLSLWLLKEKNGKMYTKSSGNDPSNANFSGFQSLIPSGAPLC